MTGAKDFDDAHSPAASRTDQPVGGCGIIGGVIVVDTLHGFDSEQCSRFGEVLSPLAVGEEAVVSDAVEPCYAPRGITGFMQSPGLCGECR